MQTKGINAFLSDALSCVRQDQIRSARQTDSMALRLVGSCLKGKGRALCPLLPDASQQPARSIRHVSTSSMPGSAAASSSVTPPMPSSSSTLPPSDIASTASAIALLKSQPVHYVIASIAGRTLLLHSRDIVTLPRLNDVEIGDVIELDRIHEVGSRDYTLRAQDSLNTRGKGAGVLATPGTNTHQSRLLDMLKEALPGGQAEVISDVVDADGKVKESQSWAAKLKPGGLAHVGQVLRPETVRVRCTVVEHTKGKMEFIVKKKRRKGYKKTIRHKQTYTRLRVEGIQLGSS